MKKTKSTVFKTTLMLLATFSLVIAANAGYIAIQPEKQEIKAPENANKSEFYAEISFVVYGEGGCQGCEIPYVSVEAYGIDTSHFDTNITDIYGSCVLELEYDATYLVTIEVEDYYLVMYDFKVLDDQPFGIHMQEVEDSSSLKISILYTLLQKLNYLKN
jgi:hypothetical protein